MTEFNFEQLAKDLPLLAQSANEEIRAFVKATVSRAAQEMDVVEREELDRLEQMLGRIEARLANIEKALDQL